MEIKKLPKREQIRRAPQSESIPESDLYHGLLKAGFRAERQYPIKSFFADLAFPEERLVIEYDGRDYHQDVRKDVRRELVIQSAGFDILRVSSQQGKGFSVLFIGKDVQDVGWAASCQDALEIAIKTAVKILQYRMKGERLMDYVTGRKTYEENPDQCLAPISASGYMEKIKQRTARTT